MADLGKLSLHREVKMSLIVRDDWQLAYCTKVVCICFMYTQAKKERSIQKNKVGQKRFFDAVVISKNRKTSYGKCAMVEWY